MPCRERCPPPALQNLQKAAAEESNQPDLLRNVGHESGADLAALGLMAKEVRARTKPKPEPNQSNLLESMPKRNYEGPGSQGLAPALARSSAGVAQRRARLR